MLLRRGPERVGACVRAPLPCAAMRPTGKRQERAGRLVSRNGFTWGVATAATQIEAATSTTTGGLGAQSRSGTLAPSGDACDSFTRWREDVDLVGGWACRLSLSLEWSRIEPAEGEFFLAALEHYRRICAACSGGGILPVVTFHHFTTPCG